MIPPPLRLSSWLLSFTELACELLSIRSVESFLEEDDNLKDISEDQISLTILPDPPADMLIDRVSVVVHLKRNHKSDDDNNY